MKQFDNMAKGMVRLLGLFIACGMLGMQAQAAEQNSITALNVSSVADGTTVIKVELAQPLANAPVGFTINTPPRIALDFPNTANGLGKSVQDFNEGDLRSANIVQAGTRTRLVINLNQMLAYDTKIDGNNLLITLQGKAADRAAVGSLSRFAEAKPGAQKHTLRDIDFRRGKNGEGRIQVDLSDPGIGIDIRQQGTTLIVDFLKTSLPRNLQRKLDVVDFATPVQGVDTFAQGGNVRMVIEPQGLWEYAAYQTDNKFIVEVKPIADDPDKLVKGTQIGYAGEKLSLNLQKIDVRDALHMFADFTGLNIVLDESISGNLTLILKDVPWDQALDIILNSKELGKVKNGTVIQIAPRAKLALMERENLESRQKISELEELRTESFQLSYQKGAAIESFLKGKEKGQSILSERGHVKIDEHTRTLVIKDTPSNLEEARKIIRQIDVPVRQVLIEARFVSATDDFNRTLGGRLGYTGTGTVVGAGAGFGIGGAATGSSTRALIGGNVNLPGAASGMGGLTLSLFNPLATKVLTLELAASELDGRTKNIASPRVVTQDNVEAKISAGKKVPYQQATSSGATSVEWVDVSLSLSVTPQITPDGHVILRDLTATNNTVGAVYGGVPSQNINEVKTEVLVENGGTVVIGGVFTQDIGDSTQKVPLLGDIPVIGWLFKNNVKSDTKSELLIFITPKIMKDEMSLR